MDITGVGSSSYFYMVMEFQTVIQRMSQEKKMASDA